MRRAVFSVRVLVAGGDAGPLRVLRTLLEKNHYIVDTVSDGADALAYIRARGYDGAVLDCRLNRPGAMDVLNAARREGIGVPILMLTDHGNIDERVSGLNAGADDCLPKPYSSRELVARVNALVRRGPHYIGSTLLCGDLRLDRSCRILCRGQKSISLNNKEFQLMELFFASPNCLFSAAHLMDRVWADSEADVDVVWTYIGFLRRKLRTLHAAAELKTVRGAGYMLCAYPSADSPGMTQPHKTE